MTILHFYKYHGTGNDFVMIDNRENNIKLSQQQIHQLCTRRFGVGADGLILLENLEGYDFKMVYYNSDGNESTMCGNGGRCLVQFAHDLDVIENKAYFLAVDGPHHAEIKDSLVHLKMLDANKGEVKDKGHFIDTGSPHHVVKVDNTESYAVFNEGRRLRNEVYGTEGANVNFIQPLDEHSLNVRTYERGVEDETFSCGTGVTASALIAFQEGWVNTPLVDVHTLGGDLKVQFTKGDVSFTDVYLIGPAVQVFKATITI